MKPLDYALNLLERINRVKVNGRPVAEIFCYKNYWVWSFHQQNLWLKTINFVSREKTPVKKRPIKNIFLIMAGLVCALLLILKMRLTRSRVLVYSISRDGSRDFRLAEIFRFLKSHHIGYGEFIHSQKISLRPVFYYPDILNLIFQPAGERKIDFDLSQFNAKEKGWARKTLRHFLGACLISLKKIAFLKIYLPLTGAKTILAIDDPRYYNEMLVAAEDLGINFYAFQHGRFNQYLVGWINPGLPPERSPFPSQFFVWNQYWREKIIALSPLFRHYQQRLLIGGRPYQGLPELELLDDEVTTILIPYEVKADQKQIAAFIKRLMRGDKQRVIFKARKGEALPEEIVSTGALIVEEISRQLWREVDLVAGTYSTLLYEAAEAGRAVAVLKVAGAEAGDLVTEGRAVWLDINELDVIKKIKPKARIKTNVAIENTLRKILL